MVATIADDATLIVAIATLVSAITAAFIAFRTHRAVSTSNGSPAIGAAVETIAKTQETNGGKGP